MVEPRTFQEVSKKPALCVRVCVRESEKEIKVSACVTFAALSKIMSYLSK